MKKYYPQIGSLLVSEPFLLQPFFQRSVILLTEHNDLGSFGFVLNKPLRDDIKFVLNDFAHLSENFSWGGPVDTNSMFFLHRMGDIISGSMPICDDLWWGGDFNQIQHLQNENKLKKDNIWFFLGYSGWGKGQLAREIEKKSWVVLNGSTSKILSLHHEEKWTKGLDILGEPYCQWKSFPLDPSLN